MTMEAVVVVVVIVVVIIIIILTNMYCAKHTVAATEFGGQVEFRQHNTKYGKSWCFKRIVTDQWQPYLKGKQSELSYLSRRAYYQIYCEPQAKRATWDGELNNRWQEIWSTQTSSFSKLQLSSSELYSTLWHKVCRGSPGRSAEFVYFQFALRHMLLYVTVCPAGRT